MVILESAGAGGELPMAHYCSLLTVTLGNEEKLLGFEVAAWQ